MLNSVVAGLASTGIFPFTGACRRDSGAHPYAGTERRLATAPTLQWLALMLDEVDYGMVLLSPQGNVLHVNHVARVELGRQHALQWLGDSIKARHPQDAAELRSAIAGATLSHRRCLLKLGDDAHKAMVSVVPLQCGASHPAATVLVFGKRQVCEDLSIQSFARAHRLTATESRVLSALCIGLRARDIAARHGVRLSTVRTQVSSIRAKTNAPSISAVVQQVAVLPPLVGALRLVG